LFGNDGRTDRQKWHKKSLGGSYRRTSVEIYNRIKDDGLLGRLQFQVYDALYNFGPLTQNELHQHHFKHTQPRNIQPRVSELESFGVVSCVGERKCEITGNICMIWDVNENLPIKPEKKKSKDQLIRELRLEVQRLSNLVHPPFKPIFGNSGQGEFI